MGTNTTLSSIWESDTNTRQHNTTPAGDHRAARNRQDMATKTNMKHKQQNNSQNKHHLQTVSKKSLEGLE